MLELRVRPRCKRCGGSIICNYDEAFCLLCGQSYSLRQYHGAWGGLKTLAKYGRDYMRELGQRGGRPRSKSLAELRQQPVPEAQYQLKGGE